MRHESARSARRYAPHMHVREATHASCPMPHACSLAQILLNVLSNHGRTH
jgi:hypothetical protein